VHNQGTGEKILLQGTLLKESCQQFTLLARYQIMAFLQPGRYQMVMPGTLNQCNNSISRKIDRNSFEVDMIPLLFRSQRPPDENVRRKP
jgi:hypothetical protein